MCYINLHFTYLLTYLLIAVITGELGETSFLFQRLNPSMTLQCFNAVLLHDSLHGLSFVYSSFILSSQCFKLPRDYIYTEGANNSLMVLVIISSAIKTNLPGEITSRSTNNKKRQISTYHTSLQSFQPVKYRVKININL